MRDFLLETYLDEDLAMFYAKGYVEGYVEGYAESKMSIVWHMHKIGLALETIAYYALIPESEVRGILSRKPGALDKLKKRIRKRKLQDLKKDGEDYVQIVRRISERRAS